MVEINNKLKYEISESLTPKLTTEGDANSYTLSVGHGYEGTDEENLLVTSN